MSLFLWAWMAAAPAEPGWRAIFDGKTLAGWQAPDMSFFSVEDGAITGTVTADHKPPRTTFLVWRGGTVSDFELKFQFRIFGDKANSGMQFRSEVGDNGLVHGYQADITKKGASLGGVFDEFGLRGSLAGRGEKVSIAVDGKKSVTRVAASEAVLPGIDLERWHEYHITAVGSHIVLRINGVVTSELDDRERDRSRHAGILSVPVVMEPMKVQYRNILLKALPTALEADPLRGELLAEIDRLKTLTQQMVDSVFSFAEIAFEERETALYLTGILDENGFRIERGVAGMPTAWTATWGSGKPVIGFIADVDGLPGVSQKPGVPHRAPLVDGGPGHGEGHNAGPPLNITAALALQKVMRAHKLPGTLILYPGVAEELVAGKPFFIRAGLFKDVDVMLGAHVDDDFTVFWGDHNVGLVSVQYQFHGTSAHSASAPWSGKSALDAVELMNAGWNFRREHLPLAHRSHYVIVNGGEQPNVVPDEAASWYFFRNTDAGSIRELHKIGDDIARGATLMTGTTSTQRIVGSAWPTHFNRPVAEALHRHIREVGMPAWSEADQALARALQKELGAKTDGLVMRVKRLGTAADGIEAGSDDIGDISWTVPTIYLRYPANIPHLPGHNWANAVAMATPIAHKGTTAGAKAQALTALELLRSPDLVKQAKAYFAEQTRQTRYVPLVGPQDRPPIEINRDKMERHRPALRRTYYDPRRHRTYLEQLGIKY